MNTLKPTPETLPRFAVVTCAAMVLATLLAVSFARFTGTSAHVPDAESIALRALRFEDRPDGGILVIDGKQGFVVETVHGEQGFMRGALRGLARERLRRGLGSEQPFELIGRADGRLTLSDPATGARIDLESFGPDNAAVFARWLRGNESSRRESAPTSGVKE